MMARGDAGMGRVVASVARRLQVHLVSRNGISRRRFAPPLSAKTFGRQV